MSQEKQKFIDPITNRTFEAIKVKGGWLTPLWVRSKPEEWIKYAVS